MKTIKITAETEVPDEVADQIKLEMEEASEQNWNTLFSRTVRLPNNWTYNIDAPYQIEVLD